MTFPHGSYWGVAPLIRLRWGMGPSLAEVEVCAAMQCERDRKALDLIRPGGRFLAFREWDGDGLAFGE